MTTNEAAEKLGISRRRVQQLIDQGIIKTKKFGKAHNITNIEAAKSRKTKPGRMERRKK